MPKGIPNDLTKDPRRKYDLEPQPKRRGPKFLPIDWDKVESLIIKGCSGIQIAAVFNVTPETLYERCQRDIGKFYSLYSHEKFQKGNASLHAKQFELALKGDKTLLIWLGKQRLQQSERLEQKIELKAEVSQKALLKVPDNTRRTIKWLKMMT